MSTLHRFNRIIFNLIHFNNHLNNQTKMELYKDLHNYTNEIIQQQNSIESRLNKLETQSNFLTKTNELCHYNKVQFYKQSG